jgi:UDPglucose--hexose-1-phosphate uridylyltransferase
VAFAPARGKRPGASVLRIEPAQAGELDGCPFCEGREDRTPPEVLAIPSEGREPDSPGWTVRVVPNLYPAFERQEVVVHSPRHARSVAELSDDELAAIAEAWSARAAAEPAGYLHPLVNEGHSAGASLPHSHSQLVWLTETPPAVRDERPTGLDDLVRTALEQELVVAEAGELVAFSHPVARAPYELLITPRRDRAGWPSIEALAGALALLRDCVRMLQAAEGAVPWNAWLHHGSAWHIELVPRLAVQAGVELGAGIYVNALLPADAAAALRG